VAIDEPPFATLNPAVLSFRHFGTAIADGRTAFGKRHGISIVWLNYDVAACIEEAHFALRRNLATPSRK
jgi:hypothetical protein